MHVDWFLRTFCDVDSPCRALSMQSDRIRRSHNTLTMSAASRNTPCLLVSRPAAFFLPFLLSITGTMVAVAEPQSVRFDVAYTVGCPDVTTEEFAKINPGERLVQARFQVSSLIRNGQEDDLIEYLYHLESPQQRVQVVDYLPRTTLSTELAGNIAIEQKKERNHSVGVAVTGSYESIIKATPSVASDSRRISTVRYELLPPKDLLASSGTVQRGKGVYFKLKPSRQTSLEGGREFVVVLRVPRAWRGGSMHVHCQAVGIERGVLRAFDERDLSGRGDFVVALYADGDLEAKTLADHYVQAETRLRAAAARHRQAIVKNSYPTAVHRWGAMFVSAKPRVPENWLSRLILQRGASIDTFQIHLPAPVRDAARDYLAIKTALLRLEDGSSDALTSFAHRDR